MKKQLLPNGIRHEVFWIGFEDVLKYFYAFGICKIRENWTSTRFTGTFPSLKNQELSCISFVVPNRMEIDIVLHQVSLDNTSMP